MSEVCDPITRDGSHYIQWIHTLFGSCVYGNREAASLLLGFMSIACWLNAQFPQLIKNYKDKSADGLSIQFLLIWLFGDVANLVGCILTKQLPFQTYLAMYFFAIDCALFLQYFYYTYFPFSIDSDEEDDEDEYEESKELRPISTTTTRTSSIRSLSNIIVDDNNDNSNDIITFRESINNNGKKNYYTFPSKKKEVLSVTTLFAILLLTFNPISSSSSTYSPLSTSSLSLSSQTYPSPTIPSSSYPLTNHHHSPEPLSSRGSYLNNDEILTSSLSSPFSFFNFFEDNSIIIGRMMAWICTTLYLTSRVPQMWKNHQRKSVEGLSITMFIFAALGNLTYTMSIFVNPSASNDPSFLPDKTPYIIGSVGTLAFDFSIFIQWCIWKDSECHDPNHHHYRNHSHYRRVRSATFHSHSSMRLSSTANRRLSSSIHQLGYNTLPSNYYEPSFLKHLHDLNNNSHNNNNNNNNHNMIGSSNSRNSNGSNDEITKNVISTNGELFV